MRIAIISDIHGNLEALSTALGDIARRGVDRIVCLGDMVGYGANPLECLELIRSSGCSSVLGNHDEAVFDPSKRREFSTIALEAIDWTAGRLTPSAVEYLRSLPLRLTILDMLFVHSTPGRPQLWDYIFGGFEARMHAGEFTERVCFIGHSHVAAIYPMDPNVALYNGTDRFIINVGSVGQPRDGSPLLSYGLVDTVTGTYDNIRLPYDVKTASRKIQDAGLPQRLATRLSLGR